MFKGGLFSFQDVILVSFNNQRLFLSSRVLVRQCACRNQTFICVPARALARAISSGVHRGVGSQRLPCWFDEPGSWSIADGPKRGVHPRFSAHPFHFRRVCIKRRDKSLVAGLRRPEQSFLPIRQQQLPFWKQHAEKVMPGPAFHPIGARNAIPSAVITCVTFSVVQLILKKKKKERKKK